LRMECNGGVDSESSNRMGRFSTALFVPIPLAIIPGVDSRHML